MKFLLVLLLALNSFSFLQARFKPWYSYYHPVMGARSLALGGVSATLENDGASFYNNPAALSRIPGLRLSGEFLSDRQTLENGLKKDLTPCAPDSVLFAFESNLNSPGYFSLAAPLQLAGLPAGFSVSLYNLLPRGFSGSNYAWSADDEEQEESMVSTLFAGSGGFYALNLAGAVAVDETLSLGLAWERTFMAGEQEFSISGFETLENEVLRENLRAGRILAGLLFRPLPRISLGLVWHSPLKGTLERRIRSSNNGDQSESEWDEYRSMRIVIPARLALAVSMDSGFLGTITLEYARHYWSRGRTTGWDPEEEGEPFPFGAGASENQQDTVNLALGWEYLLRSSPLPLFLRAGLFSKRQLFQDGDNQAVTDRGFSLGLGLTLGSALTAELAFRHGRASWHDVFPHECQVGEWGNVQLFRQIRFSLTYVFRP